MQHPDLMLSWPSEPVFLCTEWEQLPFRSLSPTSILWSIISLVPHFGTAIGSNLYKMTALALHLHTWLLIRLTWEGLTWVWRSTPYQMTPKSHLKAQKSRDSPFDCFGCRIPAWRLGSDADAGWNVRLMEDSLWRAITSEAGCSPGQNFHRFQVHIIDSSWKIERLDGKPMHPEMIMGIQYPTFNVHKQILVAIRSCGC